jgi:hypothetical protein
MSVSIPFVSAVHWWSALYADHRLVSVSVRFLHLLGLMVAGGTALFVDGSILRAWRNGETAGPHVLATLNASHRIVVPALTVVIASGVLMTMADADAILHAPVFWVKTFLVALLVVNGYGIVRAEQNPTMPWHRLVVGAGASLALWLAILFAGTLLTVAA